MNRIPIIEAQEANMPKIVCRLSIHIDVADKCEPSSPKNQPRSLFTVYGRIDDFNPPYPLSRGAELIRNGLPLGTVVRLVIEDNGESSSVRAETSGKVFVPNAKQNLIDIAARYEALKLKVTPVVTIVDRIRQILHS